MHVLETLLEWFVGENGEDVDAVDADGASALMHAADFSSPEAVELLIEWGADPTKQLNLRPVMSIDSAVGSVREGRVESAQPFTPFEFVLWQLFIEHMTGFASTPRDFEVLNTALPISKHFADNRTAQLVRKFGTLAALSSAGGPLAESDIWPLVRNTGLAPDLAVKGLIPRTKRRRAQLVEREDGEQYLVVWGFWVIGEYAVSMQTAQFKELSRRELLAMTQYYKRMAKTRGTPVVKYTHAIAEHLYQFMIELNDEGWDETQDWVGPGEVLKWDVVVEALEEAESGGADGGRHSPPVTTSRQRLEDAKAGEASSRNEETQQHPLMKFEDDGAVEDVRGKLEVLISKLEELSDDDD